MFKKEPSPTCYYEDREVRWAQNQYCYTERREVTHNEWDATTGDTMEGDSRTRHVVTHGTGIEVYKEAAYGVPEKN